MDPAEPTAAAEYPTLLPSLGRNAPPPAVRFWMWLGIYLAAEVPMIWRAVFSGEAYNFWIMPFLMPSVLGTIIAIPLDFLPSAISGAIAFPVVGFALIAGYIFYAWILILLLRASTRQRSSALLLLHTTMVILNQGLAWQMVYSITL